MQDYKKVNPQSHGKNERLGCRLFNYIDNALLSRCSKHPESGDRHHKQTTEVPPIVSGSSKNEGISKNGPSNSKICSGGLNLSSEIEVEFRHTENEQEMWNNGDMKTTHAGPSNVSSNNRSAIEEFLKTRKEAMRRYYTMDPKEK